MYLRTIWLTTRKKKIFWLFQLPFFFFFRITVNHFKKQNIQLISYLWKAIEVKESCSNKCFNKIRALSQLCTASSWLKLLDSSWSLWLSFWLPYFLERLEVKKKHAKCRYNYYRFSVFTFEWFEFYEHLTSDIVVLSSKTLHSEAI